MEQAIYLPSAPVRIRYASLRNYIYWSTLIGMFSAILVFQIPFRFLVFNGIMLVNLLLLLLLVDFGRLAVWIPCFLLCVGTNGVIGIMYGTDTVELAVKEFLGISVSLLYFYYFFRMIDNDFERAFATYAKIAFWFAVIALPLWAGSCIYFHRYDRLRGLTPEPGSFCEIVLPAYYWYAYQYITSRKHGTKVAVFTLTILLSSSSLGYICMAFGAALLLFRRKRYIIAIPIIVGGLLALLYTTSDFFQMRVDDTLLAITTQDVSGTNVSTYALISNAFITQQVLKESPIIGNGIGSHPISHERFIGDIPGVQGFIQNDMADLNATEAASLTLRSLSELGILGFSCVLIFVFYFYVGGTGPYAAISNAILVSFLLKLIRDGNYFPPEQFFFVFIYMLNHRQYKREGRSIASPASSVWIDIKFKTTRSNAEEKRC